MNCSPAVSLEQKLERFLNPSQFSVSLLNLKAINDDLSYWQSFPQTISPFMCKDRVNALQTQIKDLALEFEDLVESYMSDWNGSETESSGDESSTFRFFQEILLIKPKINSIIKTLKQPSSSFAADPAASRYDSGGMMMKMVGLGDEFEELMNRVLGGPEKLDIVPIVGMAGIGKTTLAKEVFYHPIVLNHFEIPLFFTVGPQYQSRHFLLLALDQLGFCIDEIGGKMEAELGKHLHECLSGWRYLIVLDDIWNTEVWDELKRNFPDNRNGSRIIMTTRLLHVTLCARTYTRVHFLNDDQSWNLLRNTVFEEESLCDPQLEKIGRKIAKNCEGLPLAIIEVGKILYKTDRNVESWKEIAESEDPLVITIDDDTPISKTLSLSYKMLPQHLKSCFLYMGVFPKDYEIRTSKLIKLWVSGGFIETRLGKNLEKVADECLDDLVSRSLVLVCKESSRGKIKTCRIHFVFRNICISAAQNDKLFHIIKKYPRSFPQGTNRQRGLCFHNNTVLGFKQVHRLMESVSTTCYLLCFGPRHQHPLRVHLHFPSLRVLDAVTIRFYKFPHQVVELNELRYLAITYDGDIPASISRLCNLEVLIVHRHYQSLKSSDNPVYLPIEIWKLGKLKHLQCIGYDLLDPSKEGGFYDPLILGNLLILSGVTAQSCNRGVLERMPNLMKLGIRIESSHDMVETFKFLDDFKYLSHLESFKCIVVNPCFGSQVFSYISKFPCNIRKIALSGCGFAWPNMRDLWKLENLEVLKLRKYAFCGPEWNTNEWMPNFTGVTFLLLEDLDIKHWTMECQHFCRLRCLIIRHCYKLREIPIAIAYISTLEMVEVNDCSPSVVISAQKIKELRTKIGKESFELRIHYSWDDKKLLYKIEKKLSGYDPSVRKRMITQKTEEQKYDFNEDPQPSSPSTTNHVSSRYSSDETMEMVGLNDERDKLIVWLCGPSSLLESFSIVGMAGIGKTRLANDVYNNPVVTNHFYLRLFLQIGPQYELKQLLLLVLYQMGSQKDEMGGKTDAELGENMYNHLLDRRYLVVIDDIWNSQVWDDITRFFPDNKNGSRIITTTRLLDIARRAGTYVQVTFLNDDESWNLLCKIVFTSDEESCDPQLEKIGRKIARNCEGLPLAIIKVGKLLRNVESNVESWMEIAERKDPLIITIDDGKPISETLSLSYNTLPPNLKSCFLYMGVFPNNYEIPISKLLKLWVSEGFIGPSSSKSLEKVAEECLDDLVSRSLVLVGKQSSSGKIKTCRIHFVFRNICISEARNENLFDVIKKYPKSFPEGTNRQPGCLCFHNNTLLGLKGVHSLLESVPTARSLLCIGPQHQHPLRVYLRFPSLRILDAVTIRFYKFPRQIVELVELRYLAITLDGEIPASISGLCNLEILIICRHHQSLKSLEAPAYLPMEIWKLHTLRHLKCMDYDLLVPSKENGFDDSVILENLSTLSGVSAQSCSWGVLGRMPNLRKLGIRVDSSQDAAEAFNILGDFSYLNRLESIKCMVVTPGLSSHVVSFTPSFPVNIRKIALSGCEFSWPSMKDLWKLENLEVLKLRRYAFCGSEWNTSEWIFLTGYFTGLKFLLLEDLDIQHWIINLGSYFFNLRRLIIRHCYKLQEIPIAIGYISTLEMIEVDDCSQSLVISAQRIQEEQQKNGNKSFELRVHSYWDDDKKLML